MMMQTPLTLKQMMDRAEKYFPRKQVVSRTASGIQRFTYQQIAERTRRLADSLKKLGVTKGDRVGTLAWNHHRHLESYFAIPCMGAVLHTINFRLSPQHISYIVNHAEDKILLVDADIIPLLEKVSPELKTIKAYVIMTDEHELPETTLSPVYHYETLLSEADPLFQYPDNIEENDPAGMCYTSATTGNPKGVVYSHRGIVLHSMALGLADTVAISEKDIALTVVPMFHANACRLPVYGLVQL